MENRELKMLSHVGNRLTVLTKQCRASMRQPDISARVIGNKLDNAFGIAIIDTLIVNGQQELIVVLEKDQILQLFNLADLIALARIGAARIAQ